MKSKRCLALLCVVTILCSFFLFGEITVANSYEVTAEEDFIWEVIGADEVRILGTALSKSATEIVIPEKIDGKNVVEIGTQAFFQYERLKSVTVPKTVRYIGRGAFSFSYSMEGVIVSEENPNYRSENGVLYSKDKKELCYVPAAVTGEFVIPWEVELIWETAFESCRGLQSVCFSCSVDGKSSASAMETGINGLFSECTCLREIRVDEGHALFQAVDGALLSRDGKILLAVPFAYEANEYVVPDGVEEIEFKCFSFCETIESVRLPDSIRSLDKCAFYGCLKLREVVIPEGVRELEEETFLGCSVLERIVIPDSVVLAEKNFVQKCERLGEIEAGGREDEIWEALRTGTEWERATEQENDSIEEPREDVSGEPDGEHRKKEPTEEPKASVLLKQMSGAGKTEVFIYSLIDGNSIVIEGLTETAKEDREMRALVIPDVIKGALVVGIADGAFKGIPLTSVELPSGLQEIGRGAFYGCNLKQVTIPKYVCYIGPRAFGANYGLERIEVTEGNGTYASSFGCLYTYEESILLQVPANYEHDRFVVPESVEIIEEYAFGNNRKIKTIQMKKEDIEIREKAFWNMLSYED